MSTTTIIVGELPQHDIRCGPAGDCVVLEGPPESRLSPAAARQLAWALLAAAEEVGPAPLYVEG